MVFVRLRLRSEALANQWLEPSKLYELQFIKLKAILAHAYQNVPFHRRRFKERGLNPDSIRSMADLRKLPIMTKPDLQSTPINELISQSLQMGKCARTYTSGTSGTPVCVLHDRMSLNFVGAWRHRFADAIGLDPWERAAALRFTGPENPPNENSLKLRLSRWLLRRKRRYSRCFFFTYSCDEILDELLGFKPVAVEGRPAYLRNLAMTLKKSGRFLPLKVIISSGDILDEPTKRFLESFFQCPLYDAYGANDAGPMAWQCKQRSAYHMDVDFNVYEFIKDGETLPPSEPGNLIITNLNNYAMPLIRYEVGDVVSYTDEVCPCGRSLPLIKSIEGRASDFLILSNGRIISPRTLLSALHEVPDTPAHQLLQTKPDEVTMRFYSDDIPENTIEQMINKCKELFGDEVIVRTTVIKEEPRAKIRPLIPYTTLDEFSPLVV